MSKAHGLKVMCWCYYLPLISCFSSRCPATTIFGDNVDIWVISLVLCLQTGQAGWRGHTSADCNFAQTLEPMSGSHCNEQNKTVILPFRKQMHASHQVYSLVNPIRHVCCFQMKQECTLVALNTIVKSWDVIMVVKVTCSVFYTVYNFMI